MAYDSYDWPPLGHGWPVSFFVVSLIFVAYLLAGLPRRRRRTSPTAATETDELALAPARS
jgi:zinc/manganese transport system permease protein